MHEMSIAMSLLDGVLDAAGKAGATRVESVELEVGALQLVVPEALETAWEAVRSGTLAEQAALNIRETPATAECRNCGRRFEPDVTYSFQCPGCNQADVKIVGGNEIILKSVVCQIDGESETK